MHARTTIADPTKQGVKSALNLAQDPAPMRSSPYAIQPRCDPAPMRSSPDAIQPRRDPASCTINPTPCTINPTTCTFNSALMHIHLAPVHNRSSPRAIRLTYSTLARTEGKELSRDRATKRGIAFDSLFEIFA
ncbi:uncharacterized protein B0I36DRAFT_54178 [Microdochium trichocladiopsis]|uniref:Uncharacterized protein n=1 Tax=Microdochium trichocladiopsis TaxID=1682393 RepID=A0A9P8XQE7_9PEZI|nr:uncharacterized protein B0I36DRAFT_54178 [Microdochium trichocladiopsis]KAH7012069.1 hypothetical protein B0I36DRAFT_54178 [Microdochium trichocladiopsis]